jgi:heme o synthase
VPAALLTPISLIPVLIGAEGRLYLLGAALLGLAFLHCARRLAFEQSNRTARQLLLASIAYLPSVLLLMLLNRV